MKLIRGARLTPDQRRTVLNAFVFRYTGDHKPRWAEGTMPNGNEYRPLYANDEEWLKAYAFYFRDDGQLSNKPNHCEEIRYANFHPVTLVKKERSGFGRWHTVITKKCLETGKELREVKNWSGPRPRGGFYCPHCKQIVDIG